MKTRSLDYTIAAGRPTNRLIVTNDDSGAGHLMQARIADQVLTPFHRLVWGPMPPATDPETFFADREALYDADPLITHELWDWERAREASRRWRQFLAVCKGYERVELWIDAEPAAQLQCVQWLDRFARHPDLVEKLYIVHADTPLGERSGDDLRTASPRIAKVGHAECETATAAWQAWCSPTPQAWNALLSRDLDALPWLRHAVLLLLDELPAVDTGLGATERLLLAVIGEDGATARHFFDRLAQGFPDRVHGFWEGGRILDRFARCPVPVVTGIAERHLGMALMQDVERCRRYMQSPLSLSAPGSALAAGRDDFARHNPIRHWWGGTLLTTDRLWRWDAVRETLTAP